MIISELDEVLYWNNIEEVKNEITRLRKQYYPNNPDAYFEEKNRFYLKTIKTKQEFSNRFFNYKVNGAPIWVSGKNQNSDDITYKDLEKAYKNASIKNGKLRSQQTDYAIKKWAYHLDFYSNKIVSQQENSILELTIGAGVGTSSVIRSMNENDKYFGIDIDFVCAKTADGIGKFYNKKALGFCCNLWRLPFDDEMFSVVCSHLGIDECREIPQIIKEAVRVLKPNGTIVFTCRDNGYIRHKGVFDLFDYCKSEAIQCLKDARLYSCLADLDEIMRQNHLTKTNFKQFEGHRYVVEYTK